MFCNRKKLSALLGAALLILLCLYGGMAASFSRQITFLEAPQETAPTDDLPEEDLPPPAEDTDTNLATDQDTEDIELDAETEISFAGPTETEEPVTEPAVSFGNRTQSLGNWSHYNGFVFENATIYESISGGGLAVGGALEVYRNYTIGSTYTSQYDPTQHIGQYTNENQYAALLLGGNAHTIGPQVTALDVYGGPIVASEETLLWNQNQVVGFLPKDASEYESLSQQELDAWFKEQYSLAVASSRLFLEANEVSIPLAELSSGAYRELGPEYFQNQKFAINGEVYENALFITVNTGSDLHFGQWWPEYSIINIDINWALAYDLVVFNFPDARNVTMNSSTFQIENASHWSTTVDAWIGSQGMAERLALAEKVVYNFPQASNIEANQALIQGTIFAPQATFTGIGARDAGHIYGHIIVKNFIAQGNFTIHAFFLSHWVYDIVYDSVQSSQDTGILRFRHYLYFKEHPTNIRLEGGEFAIRNENGLYYAGNNAFTEDITGAALLYSALLEDTAISLPLGAYVLEKLQPPDGFLLNADAPDQEYTYFEKNFSLSEKEKNVQLIQYTEPAFRDITFKKTDAETGAGIPGAAFTIVRHADDYEGATIGASYTSGNNGTFTSFNLPMGSYQLVETDIPPGYTPMESEYTFTIFWDSESQSLQVEDPWGAIQEGSPENPVEIPNISGASAHTVSLFKYARDLYAPGVIHPLAGGVFILYRQDESGGWENITENLLGEPLHITTNTLGYYRISHIPAGNYRLVETKAPPGYLPANIYTDGENSHIFPQGYCYSFTFDERSIHYTAQLENTPITTPVTVQVKGPFLDQSIFLGQTVFTLEHQLQDSNTWEEVYYRIETDALGECRLENLPAGNYRLTQISAKTGYHRLSSPTIYFGLTFTENETLVLTATYEGNPVTADTSPVSIAANSLGIQIQNDVKTRAYSVYAIDGAYTVTIDENNQYHYQVDYLPEAEFRLVRREGVRSGWEEYGPPFTSSWQFDETGAPILDSHGNPITQAFFPYGLMYGDYRLVQTKFTDGYTVHAQMEIEFSDGTKGLQVNTFSITEDMTGSGGSTYFTATNYKIRDITGFQFTKTDAGNTAMPLSKSEFTLYSCDLEHQHDPFPTNGSCWSKNTPVIATSNTQGIVSFYQLTSRDYLLEETEAPPGYQIPKGTWLIQVNAQQDQILISALGGSPPGFLTVSEGQETHYLLPNAPTFSLPFTGGQGSFYFLAVGLFFTIPAYLFYSNTTNRKE